MNKLKRMEFVSVTLNRLLKEIDPDILTVFGITLGVSKRTLNKLVKEFETNGKIESL